jgi:hypothetical protein
MQFITIFLFIAMLAAVAGGALRPLGMADGGL